MTRPVPSRAVSPNPDNRISARHRRCARGDGEVRKGARASLGALCALNETPKGATQTRSPVASLVGESDLGPVAVEPDVAVKVDCNGAPTTMSERWLGALLAHSSDLIAVLDDQARVIYANEAAEYMLGFVPDEQIGRNVFELIHPDDLQATEERFLEAARPDGTALPAVFRFKTASGDWRVLEATANNCLDDPAVKGIVVNAHDVTEHTNLSRALRTLAQGNQVLVRATSEVALLADMCQTIVASGGYLLAWVGYVGHDEAHTVRPVASAGRTGYLNGLHFSWGDDEFGRGPAGTAIRTRSLQVLRDISRSKAYPWRAAAEEHGLRTSSALPLVVGDDVTGVLNIYAGEPGDFGRDEVAVLVELADDLAYGIGRLRDAADLAATVEQLARTLEGAVAALGATTELRDPYTAGHQRRVAELACTIARTLGWDEARLKSLSIASVLHDIGKIVIPAEILVKPGRLSEMEMQLIRQHASAGAEIVGSIGFAEDVAEIICQHHERLDGSGYPKGLRDEEILPEARVLAVADVVEAMISHRPYRPALPIELAIAEIEDGSGIRYDAEACRTAILLIRDQGFTFTT